MNPKMILLTLAIVFQISFAKVDFSKKENYDEIKKYYCSHGPQLGYLACKFYYPTTECSSMIKFIKKRDKCPEPITAVTTKCEDFDLDSSTVLSHFTMIFNYLSFTNAANFINMCMYRLKNGQCCKSIYETFHDYKKIEKDPFDFLNKTKENDETQ